jgi:predicted ester cyclase
LERAAREAPPRHSKVSLFMPELPTVLHSYFDGLKTHDVEKIGRAVADDLAFVSPGRTLTKDQFLAMLRSIYAGFPNWHYECDAPEFRQEVIAVKFRQGGSHTGTFALPGLPPIAPTGKIIKIPEHYFFYKLRGAHIIEIRPEPVAGGAPRGILEQLGVTAPIL